MANLTWFEFSAVGEGDTLLCTRPFQSIGAGVEVTVVENGLNEIFCGLVLRCGPGADEEDDVAIHPDLDPGADGTTDPRWQSESPFCKES